jgi:hypothetical protein
MLVRPDQWFGSAPPSTGSREARAELVRRYLHCYGPSSHTDLAGWAGISTEQAGAMWATVEGELTEVEVNDHTAFILSSDQAALLSPPLPEGTRLLPPHDPILQMRDRSVLVPDVARHGEIWRSTGNPGVVLNAGEAIGTWRPQKKGREMGFDVELFRSVRGIAPKITEEAGRVAALRGARLGRVSINE